MDAPDDEAPETGGVVGEAGLDIVTVQCYMTAFPIP